MSKVVVIKSAGTKRKDAPKSAAVGEKRVRDASSGKLLTVRTLDGKSATFGRDLTYVFTKNVSKARRENKQVTGTPDRVPAKG
ncbi:MAG: hypothetical protein B7Z08_01015 [Sphingomonadales bacterium 32-68-7]|nr:MAG: hypothetical protein B7Z33_03310 [Sphingomonadales bacterium 12-68-11]OYX10422.1 MAG: hypothetical protein B7Z08_01015 [Sphingomonadales bacterium 32-68-7]